MQRRSALIALLGSLLLLACRSPVAGAPSGPRKPCVELANAFASLAHYRDRGISREKQVEIATERLSDDGERLRQWLHMIDLVYRYRDASGEEIGWTVLDHCSVDVWGRARVTTLWPKR